MTISRNLACKDGLVYVPKHSRRTYVMNGNTCTIKLYLKSEDLLALILAV